MIGSSQDSGEIRNPTFGCSRNGAPATAPDFEDMGTNVEERDENLKCRTKEKRQKKKQVPRSLG